MQCRELHICSYREYAIDGALNMRMLPGYGRKRREGGQAMVEFALVVTFIFLLFVSILQLILLMYAYNTLADAAKEGLRYAIVHGTGVGKSSCSGPGTLPSVSPAVSCTDSAGTNVVNAVVGQNNTCYPTCGFGKLSFQTISTTNNKCSAATGNSIDVCYDPQGANTSNTNLGKACSQAGCLVRVTVSHTYNPFFGFSWPSVTLVAAAQGAITD